MNVPLRAALALLGGAFVTAVWTALAGPPRNFIHPGLLETAHTNALMIGGGVEKAERLYYVSSVLLLLPLLAIGGRCFAPGPVASPWIVLALAVAFTSLGIALGGGSPVSAAVASALCLALLALVGVKARDVRVSTRPYPFTYGPESSARLPPYIWQLLATLAVVHLVIAPRSYSAVGATLTDPHVASFYFGPALSYLSPTLLPGLDFESHYGIGHAFLFSHFLGENFLASARALAYWQTILIDLFYCLIFVLCRSFFRSSNWALLATLALLTTQFEGLTFHMPSNSPQRFLIIPLAMLVCAQLTTTTKPALISFLAGALCAIALYWQSDTGLFLLLVCAGLVVLDGYARRRYVLTSLSFTLGLLLSGAVLAALQFGQHTLDPLLWKRLVEPMTLYGGGFGGVPIAWSSGWAFFYAVLAHFGLLASLGYALRDFLRVRHDGHMAPALGESTFLYLLSAFAILSLTKWLNRSIDGVWWINAWPLVLLAVFGLRKITDRLMETHHHIRLFRVRKALLVSMLLTAAVLVCGEFGLSTGPGETPSPARRWWSYARHHPSIASGAIDKVRGVRRGSPPPSTPVNARAAEVIRERTLPGEPVFLISNSDWLYLLQAHRPPASPWLPLHLVHTKTLLERTEKRLKQWPRVFVEDGALADFKKWNPPLHGAVTAILDQCFTQAVRDSVWLVYENRCQSTSGL